MPPSIPRKRTSPAPESSRPKKKAATGTTTGAVKAATNTATGAVKAAPKTTKATKTAPKISSTTKTSPKTATSATKTAPKTKATLFDDIDAPKTGTSAEEARAFLAALNGGDEDSDSDDSDLDSDDFEEVPHLPPSKRRKTGQDERDGDGDGDDSDEMDFEDVDMTQQQQQQQAQGHPHVTHANDDEIEDINISLNDDGTMAAEAGTAANKNVKKGPSKRDRQIRLRTHMMHVQSLVFHNAVRNSWLNDKEVQTILVDSLSDGVKKEVIRWRVDMGYQKPPEEPRKGKKGKRKSKAKDKEKSLRDGRDWGIDADRLEEGAINMSKGDPLMRLLKVLAAYWKKRFTVTAPGVRKQGYMPLRRLADDIKHWEKNKAKNSAEEHGERIDSISHFRKLAKACEGSRDVGSQLFTALMRGLGIEARMVASLQPVGFGWSKAEDAAPKKATSSKPSSANSDVKSAITISDDDDAANDSVQEVPQPANKATSATKANKVLAPQKPIRKETRGSKTTITQSDSSSDLSDAPSSSDDDASIIDITPSAASIKSRQNLRKFDRDLAFPHYWTEVLSPVSKTYIPVDPIVLSTIASNAELLSTFEPRGRSADAAKQVICYTLAYNPDATAKDVTIRYLKRHQLPGRTKGFRMPIEKVPIYNKKGKVLRYEEQDWFSTVILPFLRHAIKRTEADKKEDDGDLKPFKPAKEAAGKDVGEESLQWYKQSAEFVLERHLRREEALLPSAEPVRTFTSGKGDKAKSEPVYSRADVVACKTVESWHKEGRQILPGAQPMKMVPVRAVTLIRKREMEDVLKETGEKLKQGLYARKQTEWIIPPPIGEDRKIPKNAFGNMDVYVPSMVPKGAVHVRLKGCAKLCRKMNLEHAEACVGFEFGKQRAVPVIFGVVVAEENEDMVRDAWRAEQEIQKRKEDVKREALVLGLWRKFTMGLRIVERMKSEYKSSGGKGEEVNPFVNRDRQLKKQNSHPEYLKDDNEDEAMDDIDDYSASAANEYDDESGGGGFFLPGEEEAILAGPKPTVHAIMDEDMDYGGGGGFLLEDEEEQQPLDSEQNKLNGKFTKTAPMSLQSAHRHLDGSNQADERMKSEDDEDEDDEPVLPVKRPRARAVAPATSKTKKSATPAKKPAPKPKAASKVKAPAKRSARKPSTLSEEDEDDASDLTDLESASASDNEEVEEAPPAKAVPSRRRNRSPKVVIPPQVIRLGSIKSRYFTNDDKGKKSASKKIPNNDDDDDDDNEELDEPMDDEELDDDSESEEEVVKPRQTTARTRRSMA